MEGVAVLILAAVAVVVAGWWVAEQVLDRRLRVRRRVIVNLTDNTAVSGVMWARTARFVVIRDGTLMEPGREQVAVDGEQIIERARILFVQVTG